MAEKEHSKNFQKVKNYYPTWWNYYRVWMAVNRWITADEFKEITGDEWNSTLYADNKRK